MDNIELHSMASCHIPEVLEIEELSFLTPWSEESFISEIERNISARYMVAKCDGRVAGYGGMWLIVGEGHITNVAVHPMYRGRGIGNVIVEGLIDICRKEGIEAMTLEVRRTNIVAQNLYKKYGFESAGIRPKYYGDNGEDAIIMWKRGL